MKTHILHLTNIVQLYCMMSHEIVLVFKSSDVLLRCLLRSVKYLKIYCVNYSFFKVILSNKEKVDKRLECFAFIRRFFPKRLTITFRLYIFISMCVSWESNPQPFALLTQCSTTEPQEHRFCLFPWRNERVTRDQTLPPCTFTNGSERR